MLEHWQKHDGFLQQVNPILKLVSLLMVIAVMVAVFDPWTPLAVVVLTIALLRWLGGIPLKVISLFLLPFSIFAFSFVWISVLFPRERGTDILFHLLFVPVTRENVLMGAAL